MVGGGVQIPKSYLELIEKFDSKIPLSFDLQLA